MPNEKLTQLQRAMIEHDDDMARLDRNTIPITESITVESCLAELRENAGHGDTEVTNTKPQSTTEPMLNMSPDLAGTLEAFEEDDRYQALPLRWFVKRVPEHGYLIYEGAKTGDEQTAIVYVGALSTAETISEAHNARLATPAREAVEWQPIETAPRMRNLILFAVTDTDPYNWKMDTGYYSEGAKCWVWSGYQVKAHMIQPTHWKPISEPPAPEQDKQEPADDYSGIKEGYREAQTNLP